MYIYIYICIYVAYMWINKYILYTCVCTHMYVHMCMYIYIYIYVHIQYIYIYTHNYICMCKFCIRECLAKETMFATWPQTGIGWWRSPPGETRGNSMENWGKKKNEKRTTGFLSYAQFALDILGLPGFPVSDTPGTITDLWSIIL